MAVAVLAGVAAVSVMVGLAFVAAHLVTIPDRTGRRLSLSPMVTLAALLLSDGGVVVILAGAALGMPMGWWIVRTVQGDRSLDHLFPAEPLALGACLATYGGIHVWIFGGGQLGDFGRAVAIGVAALAWYAAAALVRALASPGRRRVTARVLWWQALRDGPAYVALFSGGAMFGLAWGAMSWWALPVALLPYGFSHLSLQRVATTTRTYRQTMTALGRIPEAGGLVGHGRAERTAALAAEVAGEVRLSPADVERVEYAGLLHDVGRVVFNDPAVAEGGYSDSDVAAWGAAIILESPYLSPVAQLVADQYKPYRRAGEARNELLPRAAQVVRVAAAYDRTLHEEGSTAAEALEELYRGSAYDFDPAVVAALRRVLQRRGVAGI
ncbi:MAG: HD domain-containing protein [Actinobacteria bacterium]|nr:HD domain-containing protein [Actinomycetota bacterium]MBU1493796.1 HD domain-containing protein [Actinomycetota bacterium]